MLTKILVWFLLFNKRLFKKLSFVLTFLSVILIAVFLKFTSTSESGIVSIALCPKNSDDAYAKELISKFIDEKTLIHFEGYESEEEARKALKSDRAQAVWIFKENIPSIMEKAAKFEEPDSVVKVIQSKDTIALKFSREILFSRIFPIFSYEAYKSYVKNTAKISSISEQTFKTYYKHFILPSSLVKIKQLDSEITDANANNNQNLMLYPLRGMLAIWVLICAFSACLYFLQDFNKGTFVWIKKDRQFFLMLGMIFLAVIDACALFLVCIAIFGVFTNFAAEIISLLSYAVAVVLFSCFFLLLLRRIEALSCAVPAILIASLVFTPVYINLAGVNFISRIFPGYYYLNGITSPKYLFEFLIYIAVLFFADFLLFKKINVKRAA